ncbi:TRAFAC clade GTPase domain-containing protein [Aeoliella sp.]|uniref:TRAFAC clade GTPase domain-containing protein n=1 Tax=Aeoliella sp. TaxID=2795800 RepID=UPI003CCBE432
MSEATPERQTKEEQHVALYSGEALTIAESRQITCARETSLVVVAGSPGSGKTTLIASLFHCFQRGPFAGFMFAGSDTCIGLDRRCFLGRTISRGIEPNMERTKVGTEQRLIHFRVRSEDLTEEARDVLITDISGEEYEDIRHSMDECRKFALFQRADHIVILVDGARIADSGQKHAAKVEVEQFLGFLHDAGHFDRNCNVHVLVGKCDLLADEAAKRFSDLLKDEIVGRFQGKVAILSVGDIAARPRRETSEFRLGHGLSSPFASWLERPQRQIDLTSSVSDANCHSEFDRLLLRQGAEVDGGRECP